MKQESKKISMSGYADTRLYVISQILALGSLVAVLKLALLPALLASLLIYHLVHVSTPLLSKVGIIPAIGKIVTLMVIASIVMAAIIFGAMGLASFLNGGSGGLIALLQKMADVVDTARGHIPAWMQEYLPANVVDMQEAISQWLREYAVQLSKMGRSIGVSIIYILTGLIIGGMIAFNSKHKELKAAPLTKLLTQRATMLHNSFSRIIFSQVKISAINTLLTAIFIVVVLPMFGAKLPFTKIMISVTFIVGLLPVIGNLISNTVIVLISLSVSPSVAFGSLAFLVVIHKLEYFLNAHIIGTKISARAWEILLAMLVMEAAFGITGVIAAPIYYAYLKDELAARHLI